MDITSEQLLQFDFTNAHISSLLQKQKNTSFTNSHIKT